MTLCNIKNDINYWENTEFRPIVDNSLLLWLTSDSEVGSIWTDRSNQNIPVIYGGYNRVPIDTNGLFGNAIRLDGSTGYISVSNNALFNTIKTGMTASIWINQLTWNIVKYNTILNRRIGTESGDLIALMGDYKTRNNHCFNTTTSNGFMWACGISSQLNKWCNITATYDGSFMNIYINNQLLTSKPHTGTLQDETTPLVIGAGDGGTFGISEFTNALFGDVLLYNRALSDVERTYNYTHSPLYYIEKSIM